MRALCFLMLVFPCLAQAASCADTAQSEEDFQQCAQKEILPLEMTVVHLYNEARGKYKADPQLVADLDRTEDAWNTYRNGHCSTEAKILGKKSEVAAKRAFHACAKRTLEIRIKELRTLTP